MAPKPPDARAAPAEPGRPWLLRFYAIPLLRAGERAAHQPAGERAGVLAVLQQDLAVDDGGRDPPAALREAPGAGRQVVDHFRHLGRDGVGIEDDEVGRHALADEAAIG